MIDYDGEEDDQEEGVCRRFDEGADEGRPAG